MSVLVCLWAWHKGDKNERNPSLRPLIVSGKVRICGECKKGRPHFIGSFFGFSSLIVCQIEVLFGSTGDKERGFLRAGWNRGRAITVKNTPPQKISVS